VVATPFPGVMEIRRSARPIPATTPSDAAAREAFRARMQDCGMEPVPPVAKPATKTATASTKWQRPQR
jgi:hypothetical protein